MAYRELELTLLSARDLKSVNLITRMDVYAVVTISGDPLTRQCTPTDPYGGRHPCWNATFRFAVPPTAEAAGGAWLHVLLRSERVLGDRDVGEVVVPLADLLAGAANTGPQPPRLESYQVRTVHRGEPRGMLNVSYRLGPVVAPVDQPAQKAADKPPVVAYPVPVDQPAQKAADKPPVVAYPVPPQQFYPPADAYPPAPPRAAVCVADAEHDEEAPLPGKAKSNGLGPMGHAQVSPSRKGKGNNGNSPMGPTQVYVGPHTQIFLGAPARSNSSPAKADASRPNPFLHHGTESSPGKTDHPWSKASVQQQDTQRVLGNFDMETINQRPVATASRESAISPRVSSRPPWSRSSSSSSSSAYSSTATRYLQPTSTSPLQSPASGLPISPSPQWLAAPRLPASPQLLQSPASQLPTSPPHPYPTMPSVAASLPPPSSPHIPIHSGVVPSLSPPPRPPYSTTVANGVPATLPSLNLKTWLLALPMSPSSSPQWLIVFVLLESQCI